MVVPVPTEIPISTRPDVIQTWKRHF